MQFPSSPKAEDLKVEATEVDGQASLLVESLLVEGEKRVEGEKGVEVSSPACESLTQFKTCR